jgi:hypothetical protein
LENYNRFRSKVTFGFVGTVEGIYSTNINETAYYNANFENPVGTINGPDIDLCSQEMIMVLVLIIMLLMR